MNHSLRRGWLAALFLLAMLSSLIVGSAQIAQADQAGDRRECNDQSQYVNGNTVSHPPQGFRIHVTPTQQARSDWGVNVTNSMWHSVQDCVSGLYGELADSIWQQLDCHRLLGRFGGGGDTYDLESWAPPLDDPNTISYLETNCLNDAPLPGPPTPTLPDFLR